MRTTGFLMLLPALALLSACTTYDFRGEQEAADMAAQQQRQLAEERAQQLRNTVQDLQREVEQLRGDLTRLRAEQGRASSSQLQSMQASIDDLGRRLAAESSARERDKQVILDSLSGKIATLMKSSSGSSSSRGTGSSSTRRVSSSGFEHVVEPGQTLSAIAAAYKVKVDDLMAANDIKKPEQLRVGQKLFIPAP